MYLLLDVLLTTEPRRYANMDYILLSALADTYPQELTVSYDIACQWRINFAERMEKLPEQLRRDWSGVLLQSGLPVWHALAHECKNENNLTLLPGVGKTDGEGIERLWAILNGSAWQTKEMTLGNRADTLEDVLDSHNYLKNLSQCECLAIALCSCLRISQVILCNAGWWLPSPSASARSMLSRRSIKRFTPTYVRSGRARSTCGSQTARIPTPTSCTLRVRTPDGVKELADIVLADGPSEADIRLTLKQEEQEAAAAGRAPLHATSATAFLTAGLQLEDAQ